MKYSVVNVVGIFLTFKFPSAMTGDICEVTPNIINTRYTRISDKCCCKGKILPPSNITSFPPHVMKECSTSIKRSASDDIDEHFWKLYECVVKKSINYNETSLTIKDFAQHIIVNYPKKIKSKILRIIEQSETSVDESVQGTERLKLIRKAYYDVEQEVCYDSDSKTLSLFTQIRSTAGVCFSNDENNMEMIRGYGMCCNDKPVPLHIKIVNGNHNLQESKECVKDLISNVGTLKEGALLPDVLDFSCQYIQLGFVTKEELFKPVDYDSLITKVFPNFLSEISKTLIYNAMLKAYNTNYTKVAYANCSETELLPIVEKSVSDFASLVFTKELETSSNETVSKTIITSALIHRWLNVYIIAVTKVLCKNHHEH